jgi:hypothetical protein
MPRPRAALSLLPSLLLCGLTGATLPTWGQTAPRGGEPAVEHKVSEDDGVRIDELRVRGETREIIVQSKAGNVRSYQIVPAAAGRDLSQDRRATGQRVWSVLSF